MSNLRSVSVSRRKLQDGLQLPSIFFSPGLGRTPGHFESDKPVDAIVGGLQTCGKGIAQRAGAVLASPVSEHICRLTTACEAVWLGSFGPLVVCYERLTSIQSSALPLISQ
jgi:hypothetical protein